GEELGADSVLQDRLRNLSNVTIITEAQTTEITGKDNVNGITYLDRNTNEEHHIELEGVFVQIGLVPNTEWLGDVVEKTKSGEIVVDRRGATSIPGVFAAGDCTDSAIEKIISTKAEGAIASLSSFKYLIRQTDELSETKA